MTRKEWVDHRLRSAILDGSYAPGQALVISTLADELGLSATPLREALQRLCSEGLVELVAHGSARVASVSLAGATEIYELRRLLEPMAIESAVARSDDLYRAEGAAAELRRHLDQTLGRLADALGEQPATTKG